MPQTDDHYKWNKLNYHIDDMAFYILYLFLYTTIWWAINKTISISFQMTGRLVFWYTILSIVNNIKKKKIVSIFDTLLLCVEHKPEIWCSRFLYIFIHFSLLTWPHLMLPNRKTNKYIIHSIFIYVVFHFYFWMAEYNKKYNRFEFYDVV